MNRILATILATVCLSSAWAAVELAPIYGDAMVLQQGKPIPICGSTDSPRTAISVSYGGETVQAEISGKSWRAILPPMKASSEGKPLVVQQGKDSATLNNVVVGEVWIASGQSNMLWRLNQTPGNRQTIEQSANGNFRFYHSEPQVHTNRQPYGEREKQILKKRTMYVGKWAESSPQSSPRMSAVGYYFGQALQKHLQVPVGIIHVSLGGSNMMAWFPESLLKRKYPNCMGASWLESKYASEWVRGRAGFNVGQGGDPMLHPYAPSYLFDTGLKQWKDFPVAGVIWYQGESDAEIQDPAQNYQLLSDLITSWRDEFDNKDMPFLQVQLPRINDKSKLRAYWPEFRQVQARAAAEMEHVHCVVTMDLGSTNSDVHPPRKIEVGERLAATAAAKVYGKDIPCSGPVISGFKAKGNSVQVRLEQAEGLSTTDGGEPVGFELAGADGQFHPATAEIKGKNIILKSPAVKAPKNMRYAWAVFMEPNLVNKHMLPAAPFPVCDENGNPIKKKRKKKRSSRH